MTDTLDLVARRYALALQTRPLLTKSMTSATLSFLGEFIATAVSEKRVGAKDGSVSLQRYVTSRMPKMALYGKIKRVPTCSNVPFRLFRVCPDFALYVTLKCKSRLTFQIWWHSLSVSFVAAPLRSTSFCRFFCTMQL